MNCSDTEDLVSDPRFRAIVGAQGLAGFFSLVISSVVLKRCGSLYFHINCKILIASTLIIFVVHSILITGLQAMQLFRYLTFSDPCEVVFQSVICFSLRFPTTVCTTSLVLLELSTVIERATALWKRSQYDLFGPKIGIALVAASVLLAVLSTVWAMGEEDFSQSYAYCSPVTANTTKNMMVMIFASSGISASTILSTAILLIFNSFAKKRERFDLQTSYQLCENDSVLRVLIPLEIFQAIVSGFVTTSGIIIMMLRSQMTVVNFRVLLVAINLFPYYTLVSPILLWFIIRWSRQRKADGMKNALKKRSETENDIYFRTYAEMWACSRKA